LRGIVGGPVVVGVGGELVAWWVGGSCDEVGNSCIFSWFREEEK
jgi:hypothetical protein